MKQKILLACLIGFITFLSTSSYAQITININAQPLWGPTGYNQANYYYLPDIETYYSVPNRQYIYQENNRWAFSNSLPSRYSNYNLYNGYKVILNNPKPYLSFNTHKNKYAKYKGFKGKQTSIRYSTDPKYFVIKGHPKHSNNSGKIKSRVINRSNINGAKKQNITHRKSNNNNNNSNSSGKNKGNGKGKH